MTKKPVPETARWTAAAVTAAVTGETSQDFDAAGVSIDTRTLVKGNIYVALRGDVHDGHRFVGDAFRAGAAAAIVADDYIAHETDGALVRVADTSTALADLGRAARARATGTIIAVCGSVGKTGTKEILATLFSALGKTHASRKSFNNHWGVPLSLANLPENADTGIFEVGMNHPGEITRLADQVRPHIAIITTIDQEHIEFFPNGLEGVADANAEIFDGMDDNGIAVLNIDNPYFNRLKSAAAARGIKHIIAFGEDDNADAQLEDCTLHADSSRATARIHDTAVKFKVNIPGKHIILNALGALAVVKAAGGDVNRAIDALQKAEPVTGRGNRHEIILADDAPPVLVIDDSYNANPASMAAAFQVLELAVPAGDGRRIAVLGDMLELGKDGPALHAGLANPLLRARADMVFCCGPLMEALYQALPPDWRGAHTADSKSLATPLIEQLRPGDVVLVKGSAGSKMAYVIEALTALNRNKKDMRHAL